MRLVLASAMLALSACGPTCLKSHDEPYTIPAHYETYYIHVDNMQIPVIQYIPDYHTYRRVCDQYEVEKAPK